MKRLPLLIPAALVVVFVVLAARRSVPPATAATFATPEDCVEAYREACKEGNVPAYLDCLAGPLLDEARRLAAAGELPAALRRSLAGVKSWVVAAPPTIEADSATVEVDAVRLEGTRRIRFSLAHARPTGWRIVRVDAPRDVPTPVRYGTHVSEE
jgi:hypothetical protein